MEKYRIIRTERIVDGERTTYYEVQHRFLGMWFSCKLPYAKKIDKCAYYRVKNSTFLHASLDEAKNYIDFHKARHQLLVHKGVKIQRVFTHNVNEQLIRGYVDITDKKYIFLDVCHTVYHNLSDLKQEIERKQAYATKTNTNEK